MLDRGPKTYAVLSGLAAIAVLSACIQPGQRPGSDGEDATGVADGGPDGRVETVECFGCVIADTCRDEGEVNPTNACEVCDSARAPEDWSPVAGQKSCEDADTCTNTGTCVEGACVAPLRPECDDLPECVLDVVCGAECSYVVSPGRCFIDQQCLSDGDRAPPDDPCRVCDSNRSALAWSSTRNACDDGDACTYEDVCKDGLCKGQTNTCGDAFACTLDFCDGGVCLHQVVGDECLIDGACFESLTSRPGDPCRVCRPDVSTTSLTVAVGSPCDDASACTSVSTCDSDGGCSGEPDDLDAEPNDTLGQAQELGNIGAPGAFPSGTEQANLVGEDVDLFRWGMTMSNNGLFLQPKAGAQFHEATAVELCVYARCGQTLQTFVAPSVLCGDLSEAALDDDTQGCCRLFGADEKAEIHLSSTCLAGLVQGFAFASVRPIGEVDAATCGGYVLKWGAVD